MLGRLVILGQELTIDELVTEADVQRDVETSGEVLVGQDVGEDVDRRFGRVGVRSDVEQVAQVERDGALLEGVNSDCIDERDQGLRNLKLLAPPNISGRGIIADRFEETTHCFPDRPGWECTVQSSCRRH